MHLTLVNLYRPALSWRQCLAAGLLQSTNLSFIVVAVTVGTELGRLREINGSALVLAGLVSAIALPAVAASLLGHAPTDDASLQVTGERMIAGRR